MMENTNMEHETIAILISPNVRAVRVNGELVPLPEEAIEAIREIIEAVLDPDARKVDG